MRKKYTSSYSWKACIGITEPSGNFVLFQWGLGSQTTWHTFPKTKVLFSFVDVLIPNYSHELGFFSFLAYFTVPYNIKSKTHYSALLASGTSNLTLPSH